MLKGKKVLLRPLRADDVVLLLQWENDPENWRVSGTEAPYSIHEIEQYISSSSEVRTNRQIRFVIEEKSTSRPIGTIDLFDIDFKHLRGGIGILIASASDRGKGFASESLDLIMAYADRFLDLSNFAVSIHCDNDDSLELFKAKGFKQIGERKEWFRFDGEWVDEILMQKIIR